MANYIFNCVQALLDSLNQDDTTSQDIVLTIIANIVKDFTDPATGFLLNDYSLPLTEIEAEFSISEVDDLNFMSNDDFSYFNYLQFSRPVLLLRMHKKDEYNRLVQFEVPASEKLTFLSDDLMDRLFNHQTVQCTFRLEIPEEVKSLSVKAIKDLSGEYQKINRMIQDIRTYEHELKMESAEIQLSPIWRSSRWKYDLSLWIPSADGESDSFCKSYEFDELNVLQELFGKEFVLIRIISHLAFKFKLDTTA